MSRKQQPDPASPSGFTPIEVEIGPTNPPAVTEVDFLPAATEQNAQEG